MNKRLHIQLDESSLFTERERQVIARLCAGESDKQMSNAMKISVHTINTYIDHIYQKLELKNQAINARCAAISLLVANKFVKITLDIAHEAN
ncbi:CsgD DNA-binding HTH domain-containing proteins [uncultured Caudovirales phage]|uniref:CsgD DNA-binding HTH domain-containing proteins n=1 Tax=uncultured Caudovirales phage TaxID=2100421 RepID=A0A6J5RW13_9CAUD|nr:CsgD DNA-binding HTH domain-containing proteins [uncultured Caudovirales phage]CAB4202634.1 CsgD DNA-binding HTH domain-containing proteins [uncultured Caudovirales phage]